MAVLDLGEMNALRLYWPWIAGLLVAGWGLRHWMRGHRKTADEREYERRQRLTAVGRITDGTVLDVHEYANDGQPPVQLLIYTYDVGGVSYECSQDITRLRQYLDLHTCRIGLPTSVKYDPHSPGNSIVVAEGWIGLRQ